MERIEVPSPSSVKAINHALTTAENHIPNLFLLLLEHLIAFLIFMPVALDEVNNVLRVSSEVSA